MRDLRVSLAQLSPKLGDVAANLELHGEAIEGARAAGARLVVFPELSLTGYHLKDQVPEVALGTGAEPLRRLARWSREIDLLVGFVEEAPGHRFHNAAAYLSRGRILHVHRKIYLPTYGLFQEARDFAPGDTLRSFDTPHGPAGILICEDLWHPTSAWLLAQQGAEVIFVPSNGPTRGAKPGQGITSVGVWADLLKVCAQFQTAFFVFVNRVGCEDGLSFGGGSMVFDPFGRKLAELPPLEPGAADVELEGEVLRRARTAYPLLRDSDPELVFRELERVRRARYGLPEGDPARVAKGVERSGGAGGGGISS